MTSLLRECDARGVQSIYASDQPRAPLIDPTITALQEEVLALRQSLADLKTSNAADVIAARAEGKREALRVFKRDEDAALAALNVAIDSAIATLSQRLDQLDDSALLMARTALAKVFQGEFDDMMAAAIMRQVAIVRRESILCVWVSSEDFADQAQLQRLAARIGGACNVAHDDNLKRGDCRFDLRLGRLELSLSRNWRELEAAFADLMSDADVE